MFHADQPLARRDRLVERVVAARDPERRAIARTEARDGVFGEPDFADRADGDAVRRRRARERALAGSVEGPERIELVAEEIQAQRIRLRGREDIDDAAAHGEFARLHHRFGAPVAGLIEHPGELCGIDAGAGLEGQARRGQQFRRRYALQHAGHRRQHHAAAIGAFLRKLPQAMQALTDDSRQRRHPVIRQAVPGRELQADGLGREEGHGLLGPRQGHVVAGDEQHVAAPGGQVGQRQGFAARCDAGQQQRLSGPDGVGGDPGHEQSLKAIRRARKAVSCRAGGASLPVTQL